MKIAIVGTAESSVNLAPFDDPSWEVWGLFGRLSLKRADLTFEMHEPSMWGPNERAALAQSAVPIVMREKHADIPLSQEYPLKDVVEFFQKFGAADLWTSSIAYMLAMAIHRLVHEAPHSTIGIFGVDMLQAEEFAAQRPTLEYLIGIARVLGLTVIVPEQSALLKANYVYGVDGGPAKATGVTEAFLRPRLQRYQADKAKTQAEYNRLICVMNTLDGHIAEVTALIDYVQHFNRGGVLPPLAQG